MAPLLVSIKVWGALFSFILAPTQSAGQILTPDMLHEMNRCYIQGCFNNTKIHPTKLDNALYSSTQCFCDDECHLFNDCCFDKISSNKSAKIYKNLPVEYFKCSKIHNHQKSVYMVSSCHPKHSLQNYCTRNVNEVYDYTLDVPFFNNKTKLWFQNVYCAFCHNQQEDLVKPQFKIGCPPGYNITESIQNGTYKPHEFKWYLNGNLRVYCTLNLSYNGIDSFIREGRRCTPSIDSCPNEWNDVKTKQLCESYSYKTTVSRTQSYKNPHCALCNNVSWNALRCEVLVSPRGFNISFKNVLEINWDKLGSDCNPLTDLWDPIHKKCIALNSVCGPMNKFEGGSCVGNDDIHVTEESATLNYSNGDIICPGIYLEKHEFTIQENFDLLVFANNNTETFSYGSYAITPDGKAKICINFLEIDMLQNYMTVVCLSISVICLTLHAIIYFMLPKLQNFPSKNLLALSICLLVAQFIFLIGVAPNFPISHGCCVSIAVVLHYFFLASFFWMNVLSLDIWKTFRGIKVAQKSISTYWKYSLYAWLFPAVIVIFAISFESTDLLPVLFKPNYASVNGICWFGSAYGKLIFLLVPLLIIIVINTILFSLTAFKLFQNNEILKFMKKTKKHEIQNSRNVQLNSDGNASIRNSEKIGCGAVFGKRDKARFLICMKLFLIMGLTWIVGMIAVFVQVRIMWIIFTILNGLQGAFIFFSFDFKKNIGLMLWRRAFEHRFEPPNFLSPTSTDNKSSNSNRYSTGTQRSSGSNQTSLSRLSSTTSRRQTLENGFQLQLPIEEVPLWEKMAEKSVRSYDLNQNGRKKSQTST